MKYFIDDNVWFMGEKQPPRKVYLEFVLPQKDGETAICIDRDGDSYTLNLTDIHED